MPNIIGPSDIIGRYLTSNIGIGNRFQKSDRSISDMNSIVGIFFLKCDNFDFTLSNNMLLCFSVNWSWTQPNCQHWSAMAQFNNKPRTFVVEKHWSHRNYKHF